MWDEDPVDVNLNGGSMLTMFRVTDSVGNLLGNINSQVDNPSYSFTIGSLTNGQNYSFRIYSINRDGVSGSYMLRYRTPFEYAGQTPYMNDKCAGKKTANKIAVLQNSQQIRQQIAYLSYLAQFVSLEAFIIHI